MAQVLLSVYTKHFDSLNKGVGQNRQTQQIRKLS